nr:MAG TPA: MNT REPRESSOR MUTANT WITH C-TERMINAL REGULATION [Herelleviridae sp.]
MPSDLPRYTLRIDAALLAKVAFIARDNDRSTNKEIERALKKLVSEYEKVNGPIVLDNP